MRKDNTIEAFFALVRAGLWGYGDPDIRIGGATDWKEVYQLAQEQSAQGLVLAGLEYSDIKPPKELLLLWIGEVQMIEQRNKAMNQFIADLIVRMRNADIYTILVKGQGIAQCYNHPLWRSSGDVDLFLSPDNYYKAKEFLMPMGEVSEPEEAAKKHFAMIIDQWAVELHGTLHSGLSSRIDRVMGDVQFDVFYRGNVRSWMNGHTQVFLPGVDCDVVCIFVHIIQHFFKGGIGVRQICDWCRFLWVYRDSINKKSLEQRLRKMKIMSEWKAFAGLAVEYLGMPVEAMPFYDKRFVNEGYRIMDFVIEVGNFGHNRDRSYYEKRTYIVRKGITAWRRVKDLCYHARIFPLDSVRFLWGIMFNGIISTLRGE